MASKHPLRRSCAFCRARKIKCSNETICEACRRQGADCIYDFEPPRPKARTISQDSSCRSDPAAQSGGPGGHRQRPSTGGGGSPGSSSPGGAVAEDRAAAEDAESVAEALEHSFYDSFPAGRPSPWQKRTSAHRRPVRSARGPGARLGAGIHNVKYTGLLSLLTHDLVGLVADQCGTLGCPVADDGDGRFFFPWGLAGDETRSMFDDPAAAPGGSPLAESGQRQQTQLIDVWFSVHPLSFLVSKTLLLRELRDGTHDEVLLATMLADASLSIGDEAAVTRGHVLMRWATAQLRTRPLRTGGGGAGAGAGAGAAGGGSGAGIQYSGVSTRIFSGISTAQALVLLGWNALGSLHVRRATCYTALAGRIASEIRGQMASAAAPLTSSRINGIDVFDVEKELVSYLFWTTHALSLWAAVQTGSGPVPAPTPPTSVLLPMTAASSVVIQLDLVSENFSTLQRQKAVIRDMWPLAHIASVVAYVLALHSLDADAAGEPPLLTLQGIQQARPSRDVLDIGRVLAGGIHVLNRQASDASTRGLVLLVYHVMAIHFLFPVPRASRPGGDDDDDEEAVSADAVDRFCSSASEILHIFALVSDQPLDLFGTTTPSLRSAFPDVFSLALDACARALSLINVRKNVGVPPTYDDRLRVLAGRLLAASQDDLLVQGRALRRVRKHLKTCVRSLGGSRPGSDSDSSGVPSPPDNMATHSPVALMATAEADCMSMDATAVTPSFVSPVDTTMTVPLRSTSLQSLSEHSSAASSIPFSPADDMHKPDWHTADELFHSVLDPGALGAVAGEHLGASDLDLQSSWLPVPGVMDFDMTGPMWPYLTGVNTTTTADMDSMLYYFDNGYSKKS